MRLYLTRGLSKSCGHTLYRAQVVGAHQDANGEHFHICPDCWNREGFALPVLPTVRLADGLSKAIASKKASNTSQEPDFGETVGGERWITVHPHGKDEEGHPIKVKLNRDGSHTVIGGAGGSLNGLRMTGLKSGSEYKEQARDRRAAKQARRKEKESQQWNSSVERHKAAVVEEAKSKGEPIEEHAAILEAHNRAKAEKEQAEAVRAQEIEERSQAQRGAERAFIEHWAKHQGWDESEYSLSDKELASAREHLENEHLAANEKLKAALKNGTPVEQQQAREKLDGLVENDLQRIQDAHHAQVLSRAREVAENHRQAILTAHDGLAGANLGLEALGDIAGETLGDAGKGYEANLIEQAKARGMDVDAIAEQAEELKRQAAIERADGNLDAAARNQEAARKRQEGAQAARERIERAQEKLGEGGQHLERLKELKTDPDQVDAAGAVEALTQAKVLEQQMKAARDSVREAKDADVLETLPKAAIVPEGRVLSLEEAEKKVLHDLHERDRQRAMGELVDLYNAQDAISPLRSHLYSGHNAFWGNLAQVAAENGVNLAAPDPLTADILGPSGLAHVLRRAVESGDETQAAGLAEAVKGEHVEKQVEMADTAVAAAKELLNQADHLDDFPIDSMDAMLAGLSQNEKRLNAQRQAREHLGLALGRLEAAAALNEAFMSDKPTGPVEIALGAIPLEDALKQAYAIGLEKADRHDAYGVLSQAGQFHIHHDGQNAILQIHDSGLDHLAHNLQESPEHLERIQTVKAIAEGKQDEKDWLPVGISRRPRVDVSRDPATDIPRYEKALDLDGADNAGAIAQRLKAEVAARIEAGQDPTAIISHLRSEDVLRTQVPEHLEEAYREALESVAPSFKPPSDRKVATQDYIDHKHRLDEQLRGYHDDWLKEQVAVGKMSSEEESVYRQTLPQTQSTRDLLYQVAIQDPRLHHAFGGVGELGREGRRAVREYSYEHVFRDKDGQAFNPKDKETPIQALAPAEHKAWTAWRELEAKAKEQAEQTGGDPYKLVQEHWKGEDEAADSGGLGSMFGDDDGFQSEPHVFATVDLDDDAAVIEAAKKHAQNLGYQPERRVTDLHSRAYEDVVPELEVTDEQPQSEVAREARRRVQAALREHAFSKMFSTPDVDKQFNPAKVATASERWAHYVADMGGEKRAYAAIMDKMKGDFAGRFSKGYKQLTGHDWKTVHVPLSHADMHSVASLSHEKRQEVEAQKAAERARAMNREGGKFADGGVKDRIEQQQEEQKRTAALFGSEEGRSQEQALETHRVSLGGAAEAMVKNLLPAVNLKSGTAAAGEIDMSSGKGVKQQRAVKMLEATKRLGLTLGTGSGKTLIGLAAHSHLKSQGKVKRSLFAVPSAVQSQFGSEAARFYDMTSKDAPKWFSDPGADTQTRRAAYKHDSGHDVCVVTHQALRDDLTWALAEHRFGGDVEQAKEYLVSAPEAERHSAVKQAADAQGWHFDLTATDEGQVLLNREGKENSAMANAIDSFTHDKPYHVSMSADPVKNDASESFSFLQKIAPQRYVHDNHPDVGQPGVVSRGEFLRKYSVNTPAAMQALQREMAPYHYAEKIEPDAAKIEKLRKLKMEPAQQAEYNKVLQAYQRVRDARRRGAVDVEAVRVLSPNSFAGDESTHEAVAQHLQESAGMLRDAALSRVVNLHPDGAKLRELDTIVKEHPPGEHPKIIFAHHLGAVDMIHDHLKAQGVRVVKVDGTMSGEERERRKLMFNPQWDEASGKYVTEPQADVIVYSDAGEAGWNGQRANQVIHYDTPPTAKTYRQREGRAHRQGQRRDVTVYSLMTDTDHERRRREVLEKKDAMRDALTASTIDDNGLGERIRRETDAARQRLIEAQVGELKQAA